MCVCCVCVVLPDEDTAFFSPSIGVLDEDTVILECPLGTFELEPDEEVLWISDDALPITLDTAIFTCDHNRVQVIPNIVQATMYICAIEGTFATAATYFVPVFRKPLLVSVVWLA